MDFANILFAGPCNRRCYYCIGKQLPERVNVDNLDLFPLKGLDRFIAEVNARGIREIVLTGTVTDPQLYRHEARLLATLREKVRTGARYALHTNGALALGKLDVFNQYDRVCLSFPSFVAETYQRQMGSRQVPDLERIVACSSVPVKVSCVLDRHNAPEVPEFLAECRRIGIKRLVFRKIQGSQDHWDLFRDLPVTRHFRNNPVYDYHGVEVTYWEFERASCESINLFADGTIGTSYLLTDCPELLVVDR